MKKSAFTLAEVLITLVIIGVIASMTIPTLIKKKNSHEYVSRLRKVYSTMAQATKKIIAEEGNPKEAWASSISSVYNMYKKHLVITKECGNSDCLGYTYTNFSNFNVPYYQRFVLSDGAIVNFAELNSTCAAWGDGICEWIDVDVNGIKGPNIPGVDIFALNLTVDGLIPANCNNYIDSCTGTYCTCKVLKEGKIDF